MKNIFRSLRHPNFRLFFIGQSISLVGTWMQQVAVSWLVYRLSGSAVLLGVVNFANVLPTLLFSPVAGSLIDRFQRRQVVIVTQTLFLVQSVVFTFLVLGHWISIDWIIGLSFFFGILCAFDIPGRQSFLVDMIDEKDDLANAIALHSIMFNGTRIVGPAVAGLMIAAGGEGPCFILNALSYLAPIYVLFRMSIRRSSAAATHSVIQGMIDGFKYVYKNRPFFYTLVLLALMSLSGMPFTVLMPIFAKEILKGGAHTMGFLMAGMGMGAFVGAVYLAKRKNYSQVNRLIPSACGLFGISVLSFSQARHFGVAMFFMFCAGFGAMIQMNCSNIFLQSSVSDKMRGRIMSIYTMAFLGVTPFGGLLAGILAARWGAPATVCFGGILCVIAAVAIQSKITGPDGVE